MVGGDGQGTVGVGAEVAGVLSPQFSNPAERGIAPAIAGPRQRGEEALPWLIRRRFAAQFQEDLKKNIERVQTLFDSFVTNPSDPPVGSTPSQVVWKRGKTRLLRYAPGQPKTNPLPYLIVPWLGISRPYVLDLLPGNSMIEYLVNQGHDVYSAGLGRDCRGR